MSASHCIRLHSRCKGQKPSSSMNLPFWVSFVEQTRVEIWKESLLMVQLPRFCMLFPVAECPFSSSSILVDGRLKYVEASSSFFASACSSVLNTRQNSLNNLQKALLITKCCSLPWNFCRLAPELELSNKSTQLRAKI